MDRAVPWYLSILEQETTRLVLCRKMSNTCAGTLCIYLFTYVSRKARVCVKTYFEELLSISLRHLKIQYKGREEEYVSMQMNEQYFVPVEYLALT